ncbi:MAG: iron complex outermembrane receptor protein [Cryomorphaceae bacterium]|jgi:iron complex outermembrane receptor protein
MSLNLKIQLSTVTAIAIIASPLLAQTEVQVVTATRTATPLSELPSNISVLDAQTIGRTSAEHIQQALSQVPGVVTQRGNGQESLPGIRSAVLTGAGACGSVLVMEEAIPVRAPGFCNVNELFDTHFEQASSIEVVRGPSTAYFGSNSLTGAVNVNLASDGPTVLSLELGENSYVRANGATSYGSDASRGRVYLSVTDDGGYRDESGYNQQKLSWRHSQEFSQWSMDAGLTATRLDQDTAGFIVGLDSYRDETLAKQNLDPNAFRKTDSLRAWARFSRELWNQRTLQVTPYIRNADMDFRLHFLPGDPLEQNAQSGFGLQSSLTTQISDNLKWAVGFDADVSDGELSQTQDDPTRGSAFLQATIPAGTHYDYQVDAVQVAAFAHADWQISDRWDVIAGVRLERLSYDYDNLALDGRTKDDGTTCGFGGCRYSRPADRKDDFTNVSPKLELRYQLNEGLRFYASYTNSFRAPQATELYRLQRAQAVADLDSVEADNIEFGFHYTNSTTQINVAAYSLDLDNVIIRDSDFFNVDGNKTESTGLELSLKHRFSDQWSMQVAAAVADHEYASDQISGGLNINGNQVDTAPKTAASVSLAWQPNTKLSAQLQWQHLAEYYLEPENQHEYPGHDVLNLRAQYQINTQWQASIRVLNLGDTAYAERADFTGFTGERYFPGQPRSVFAGIEYRFDR